jgi:two-component system NtrC family response regulator
LPQSKLLIVDDEETILKQLGWAFKSDYEISTARTEEEALTELRKVSPQVMILDLSLEGDPQRLEGFDILRSALQIDPRLKVIVITGHDDSENALTAIGSGAVDFYAKPVDIEELRVILKRAFYIHSLETQIEELKRTGIGGHEFEGLIAMSEPMLEIFDTVGKVAPADVSVLITGESGTGKELIAGAIHKRSQRSEKPFIPINCGAIPENLLESELFGHEKGSFTGAHASKPGKFEIADGGTLFLDEIGELPQSLQVKLLRFLQDQVIERVGGNVPVQVDVRVIAATNQNLEEMIGKKLFREDLYYRINTIRLALPSLKERGDDILLLATHFLRRYCAELSRSIKGFSNAAITAIQSHHWPGNVRELDNRVKRAVIMASSNMIQSSDLDLESGGAEDSGARVDPLVGSSLKTARESLERKMILSALMRLSGNVSASAQELDISRPALHDLMKKHNIDPADFRARRKRK